MSDSIRSLGSQVDVTYRAVTERAVDEDTLKYWTSMISGGQRSPSDVRSYLATTQDAADGIQAAY